MAQAHLARLLKGLSPYSELDPDRMMALAQQQQRQTQEDFFRRQQEGREERRLGISERGEQRTIDEATRLRAQEAATRERPISYTRLIVNGVNNGNIGTR